MGPATGSDPFRMSREFQLIREKHVLVVDDNLIGTRPEHIARAKDRVKEGGVLEQITRELNVEALPTAIPESIPHEVGEMEIGETILLSALTPPEGVTLLDDPEETVVATLSPPRLQTETAQEMESRGQ